MLYGQSFSVSEAAERGQSVSSEGVPAGEGQQKQRDSFELSAATEHNRKRMLQLIDERKKKLLKELSQFPDWKGAKDASAKLDRLAARAKREREAQRASTLLLQNFDKMMERAMDLQGGLLKRSKSVEKDKKGSPPQSDSSSQKAGVFHALATGHAALWGKRELLESSEDLRVLEEYSVELRERSTKYLASPQLKRSPIDVRYHELLFEFCYDRFGSEKEEVWAPEHVTVFSHAFLFGGQAQVNEKAKRLDSEYEAAEELTQSAQTAQRLGKSADQGLKSQGKSYGNERSAKKKALSAPQLHSSFQAFSGVDSQALGVMNSMVSMSTVLPITVLPRNAKIATPAVFFDKLLGYVKSRRAKMLSDRSPGRSPDSTSDRTHSKSDGQSYICGSCVTFLAVVREGLMDAAWETNLSALSLLEILTEDAKSQFICDPRKPAAITTHKDQPDARPDRDVDPSRLSTLYADDTHWSRWGLARFRWGRDDAGDILMSEIREIQASFREAEVAELRLQTSPLGLEQRQAVRDRRQKEAQDVIDSQKAMRDGWTEREPRKKSLHHRRPGMSASASVEYFTDFDSEEEALSTASPLKRFVCEKLAADEKAECYKGIMIDAKWCWKLEKAQCNSYFRKRCPTHCNNPHDLGKGFL